MMIGTVHGRQAKYNKTLVQMNNTLSQKSLHDLPQDIWFMILNNLPGDDVRRFLYTCKQSLTGFIWCFAKHRTDNGLIYAAKYRDRYLLRNILSNTEINVNTKDERGWAALVWAVHWSDKAMVRALATHPIIDTQRPLRYAIASMQLEIVKLMLQIGKVDFDATDNHGRTLVHEAVVFGGISIAELFASQARTLDFEKVDKKGKTPLLGDTIRIQRGNGLVRLWKRCTVQLAYPGKQPIGVRNTTPKRANCTGNLASSRVSTGHRSARRSTPSSNSKWPWPGGRGATIANNRPQYHE